MPIKKSALLLIILSVSSIGLLVFSSAIKPPEAMPLMPFKITPARCCNKMSEPATFSAWDMISQIMLRSAA